MVITSDRQHTAIPSGAAGIGVAECIDAAVHPRPLAVPHAEHAIELGVGVEFDLLASRNRRGGQLLVQARLEADVLALKPGFGPPQGLIESGKRRAAIAGNQPRRVESLSKVALMLQDGQPDQCFNAREIGVRGIQGVLVVEGHGPQ